jgi:hypothetical protein
MKFSLRIITDRSVVQLIAAARPDWNADPIGTIVPDWTEPIGPNTLSFARLDFDIAGLKARFIFVHYRLRKGIIRRFCLITPEITILYG